jgi:cyclopropane fatty-acyl-phospholipid synthase-like methyltransferase
MNMNKFENYIDTIIRNKAYSNKNNLIYRLNYLFKNINFEGKRVLEIGGGAGIYSFYAAINGAESVVNIEPEFEGSTYGYINKFNTIKDELSLKNITLKQISFQNYDPSEKFDIIISYNSINHLDEKACLSLKENQSSRQTYVMLFKKMYNLLNSNSIVIICDCSRENLFAKVKMKNPFAPNIEWEKHQTPRTWISLLEKAGFKNPKVYWTSYNKMRNIGNFLFGNRIASYLTLSHFCLRIYKY